MLHNQDARRRSSTDVPWYSTELPKMDEQARELLEEYSGISPERIMSHVLEIRDRGWDVAPYPCIGQFRFLSLGLASTPHYNEIVQRVKKGDKILDIGCCFGQEIRKLVHDGAPSENCYGCDNRPEFWEMGYDFFLDRNRLNSTFIAADFFDLSSDLAQFDGQFDILYAGSFLHLFGWSQQVTACKRMVSLLRPTPGALLVGRQIGSSIPGEYRHQAGDEGIMYRHDIASFKRMWKLIEKETDTEWDVEGVLRAIEMPGPLAAHNNPTWSSRVVKRLYFTVRRK